MKFHQGIAVLAVIGFAALTSGSALAGPGCSSGSAKATKTGSSCSAEKSSAMQTSGGCGAMKTSGSACGAAKSAEARVPAPPRPRARCLERTASRCSAPTTRPTVGWASSRTAA